MRKRASFALSALRLTFGAIVLGYPAARAQVSDGVGKASPVVLLDPRMLQEYELRLDGSFDIEPGAGMILLRTGDNLFDLTHKFRLLKTDLPGLEAFAFASDGALLTISNQELGYFKGREVVEVVPLPVPHMRLAAGREGEVYLYGGTAAPDTCIYVYRKGGEYQKLIEVPGRISALTAVGDDVIFAVGNGIYEAKLAGSLRLLFLMPSLSAIRCLAVDSAQGVIYFISGQALYAFSGKRAILISEKAGTDIKFHRGSLYVLNPTEGVLVRWDNLHASLALAAK